ncbi:hypothetical protein A3L09_06010 [Thermococcus profundus]|uniref:Type I-B CRISPR-associated protein Cas8b/Csh1 n=1 Tax=Thermococcus profundus TaxID=49899 RepID=A0A2Z2MBG7_THEPR|nr:hypothetical protein [Thermococcus profundus]ASJ02843.1 hypothetical protein A3L09_06010 [Thermococcus profundus]
MIEAMVRYGEYLAKKDGLDLDSFEGLVKEVLLKNRADALDKLMDFFKFAVDFRSTLIYVYEIEKQDYKEADINVRLKIFPLANLSGKAKNAVGANHPILNSRNIKKYGGIIIKKQDQKSKFAISNIKNEILKNKFNSKKLTSLNREEKEELKKLVVEHLRNLLKKEGINLNFQGALALVEKFETDKSIKSIVIIPKDKITDIDARKWIIEKLLFGDKPSLSEDTYHCPLCGRAHQWNDVKIFFPINIQSEKTLNFLPNFSPEGKQMVCVTCAYKLLRLTSPYTQFAIRSKYHANILAYPYGYTDEGIQFAEMVLDEIRDKAEGLFALPEAVWNITNRQNIDEILMEINSGELWLYLVLPGKAERVIASYHLTDFSKLAQFGKYHFHTNQFQRTVAEYMKASKKTKQHKIVLANMLASMYANFDIKSLNVLFIKTMAKTIAQKAKNPKLYGKYFISSYLSLCGGDSLSKKRNVDVYKEIYNFGVTLGELWRNLAEADKTRFNSYKAKIMKLDTPNINVLSDTVRHMIQKITENGEIPGNEKIGTLFSKHKDFPKIVTDSRARELFVTGAYFGFFSPLKEGGGKP